MEHQNQNQQMNPVLFWGVIGGAGMILLSIITYFLGIWTNSSLQYVYYAIILITIILSIQQKRTLQGGYINFGKAFITGLLTVVVAVVISALYTFIFLKYIDTSIVEMLLNETKETIYDQNLSEIEETRALNALKFIISPAVISLMSMLLYFFIGLFGSIFISIFLRNNPPENSIQP